MEMIAASMKASLMDRGSFITLKQKSSAAVPATHSTQLTSFGDLKGQLATRRAYMQLCRSELVRWFGLSKECWMTEEQVMILFLKLMKMTHRWARLTQIICSSYSWTVTQRTQTS